MFLYEGSKEYSEGYDYDLQAEDIIIAFPGHILDIAGKQCGQAGQHAESMASTSSAAGLATVAGSPGA